MKKGQATIFIIIGIIIFIAIVLVLSIPKITKRTIETERKVIPSQVEPIENFIEACIQDTAVTGLQLFGLTGGFPRNTGEDFITYYYENGIKIPQLNTLERNFEIFLQENVPECIGNSYNEYSLDKGIMISKVKFNPKNIIITTNYPIPVARDDFKIQLNEFENNFNIRIGYIYTISSKIVERTALNPSYIDIGYITSINDLSITVLRDEPNLIYSIQDEFSILDNQPYQFYFGIKP